MTMLPPSKILADWLISQGHFVNATGQNVPWQIYVGHLPEGVGNAIDAAAVYDTSGVIQSRSLATGEVSSRAGVQIEIHARDHETGRNKIDSIVAAMNVSSGVSVVKSDGVYKLANMSQASTVLLVSSVGRGDISYWIWTVNYLITFYKGE